RIDGAQPSVQRAQVDATAVEETLPRIFAAVGGTRMITCQAFRSRLEPGTTDVEVLEHLRSCDACLDHAMAIDPDNFFRAIGGGDMEPPGGVDAFASGVMAQIRLRQTEGSVGRRLLISPKRLAAAAAIIV